MGKSISQAIPHPKVSLYISVIAIFWSLLVGASLWWNIHSIKQTALSGAIIQARIAFEKDVIYRRWNAQHGGVYAPIGPKTEPNPYLEVPERDIQTPEGKALTKVNPAYMTRQVHELGALTSGVIGHITSLKPLRPQNKPDPWERKALERFEQGAPEISAVQTMNGKDYLRFMRPLKTEKVCLPCHASQGYKVGDIRGGISVSVPLAPIMASVGKDQNALIITHASLWIAVLAGLILGGRHLRWRIIERDQALRERQHAMQEALEAEEQITRLEGLLPICSSCKKIRDDDGKWQRMELYIQDHSQANFTHGICPDCTRKLYPELEELDE
jgi:hypothetical protein